MQADTAVRLLILLTGFPFSSFCKAKINVPFLKSAVSSSFNSAILSLSAAAAGRRISCARYAAVRCNAGIQFPEAYLPEIYALQYLTCMEAFSPLSVTTRAFTPNAYRPVKEYQHILSIDLCNSYRYFFSLPVLLLLSLLLLRPGIRIPHHQRSPSSQTTYGSLVHREIRAKYLHHVQGASEALF